VGCLTDAAVLPREDMGRYKDATGPALREGKHLVANDLVTG